MLGRDASIATAGSFCLFCGNGASGLPTVTRASVAAIAGAAKATTNSPTAATAQLRRKDQRQILNLYPFFGTRPYPPRSTRS